MGEFERRYSANGRYISTGPAKGTTDEAAGRDISQTKIRGRVHLDAFINWKLKNLSTKLEGRD